MAGSERHRFRWSNYTDHLRMSLESYSNNAEYADVTLCCEGQTIHAHKFVLSSCSNYFKEIFKENPHPHPLLIFNLTKFNDLHAIIKYMYLGEVIVQEDALKSFFEIAELLSVHSLIAEMKNTSENIKMQQDNLIATCDPACASLHQNSTLTSKQNLIKVAEFATEKAISANMQKQQKRNYVSNHVKIHHQPANIAVNKTKRRKIIDKKYKNCNTEITKKVMKDNAGSVNTDEQLEKNATKIKKTKNVSNGCIDSLNEFAPNDGAVYPDFEMSTAADEFVPNDGAVYLDFEMSTAAEVGQEYQPPINSRLTTDMLVGAALSDVTDYGAATIVEEETTEKDANIQDNDVLEVLEDWDKDHLQIITFRRGTISTNVTKSESSECAGLSKPTTFCGNVFLNSLSNERFFELLKVNRNEFAKLVSVIRYDVGINSPQIDKQYSVELQLAVVLCRLCTCKENAAIRNIESIFGLESDNVEIITKNVFQAIMNLMPKYICWPNNEERSKIIKDTYSELPMCIGYVDVMEIKLAESKLPNHDGFNSIKTQIVCDHKLKIRNVVVGIIGNCHNEDIFKNCALSKYKSKLFSPNEWIAGDSTYQLCSNVITPYRPTSKDLTEFNRITFNMRHNKYKVRVEQCISLLREKFASLNELEMCIENTDSHKFCCEWILTCCVLYNILISDQDVEKVSKHSLQQQLEVEEGLCSNVNANEDS